VPEPDALPEFLHRNIFRSYNNGLHRLAPVNAHGMEATGATEQKALVGCSIRLGLRVCSPVSFSKSQLTPISACIASIMRLANIPTVSSSFDLPWRAVLAVLWGQLELAATIIAASAPGIRPLFNKYLCAVLYATEDLLIPQQVFPKITFEQWRCVYSLRSTRKLKEMSAHQHHSPRPGGRK